MGVHVAGTIIVLTPTTNYLYSFDGKIYEYITYIDTLNSFCGISLHQWKYDNLIRNCPRGMQCIF